MLSNKGSLNKSTFDDQNYRSHDKGLCAVKELEEIIQDLKRVLQDVAQDAALARYSGLSHLVPWCQEGNALSLICLSEGL